MLKKLVLFFPMLCCSITNTSIMNIGDTIKQFAPIMPIVLLGIENSLIDKMENYIPNKIKEPCNNFINFLNEKITLGDYQDPDDGAEIVTFSNITKIVIQSGINTLFAAKYLRLNPIQSFCLQLLSTDIKVFPGNEFLQNITNQFSYIIFSSVMFSNKVKNSTFATYKRIFYYFGYPFVYGSICLLEALPLLTIQHFSMNNIEQNEQADQVQIIAKAKTKKNTMLLLYLLGLFGMKYYFFKKSKLDIHWKSVVFTAALMAIDFKTNATINLKNYTQATLNTIIEENSIFNLIPAQLIFLIYVTNIAQNVLQNYKPILRYSISQPIPTKS